MRVVSLVLALTAVVSAPAGAASAQTAATTAGDGGGLFAVPRLFADTRRLFATDGLFNVAVALPPVAIFNLPNAPPRTPTASAGNASSTLTVIGDTPTVVTRFRPAPSRDRVPGDLLIIRPTGPRVVVIAPGAAKLGTARAAR